MASSVGEFAPVTWVGFDTDSVPVVLLFELERIGKVRGVVGSQIDEIAAAEIAEQSHDKFVLITLRSIGFSETEMRLVAVENVDGLPPFR